MTHETLCLIGVSGVAKQMSYDYGQTHGEGNKCVPANGGRF